MAADSRAVRIPAGLHRRQKGKLAVLTACAFAVGAVPARAAVPGVEGLAFDMPTIMAGGLVLLFIWRYRNLLLR